CPGHGRQGLREQADREARRRGDTRIVLRAARLDTRLLLESAAGPVQDRGGEAEGRHSRANRG
ncbi:hypothetical protein THAOC_21119, partial [Thalassiosira oceanica]